MRRRYRAAVALIGVLLLVTVTVLSTNVVALDDRNKCSSEFDGDSADFHSCEGWLSYDTDSSANYLPDPLATEIIDDGLLPR